MEQERELEPEPERELEPEPKLEPERELEHEHELEPQPQQEQEPEPMKLSNAIIRGTSIRPDKSVRCLFGCDGRSSCTLGAAYEGTFGKMSKKEYELFLRMGEYGAALGVYEKLCTTYPSLKEDGSKLFFEIISWNDTSNKSREDIAGILHSRGL
jgi:hypothetical protein